MTARTVWKLFFFFTIPQGPDKRCITSGEHCISATRLGTVRRPARIPVLRVGEVARSVGEDSLLVL